MVIRKKNIQLKKIVQEILSYITPSKYKISVIIEKQNFQYSGNAGCPQSHEEISELNKFIIFEH